MTKRQRTRLAYFLILPSLFFIVLLNLYPLVEGVILSLQSQNLTRPNPDAFVGLKHYRHALFGNSVFWSSLYKTILWTLGAVSGSYVVSLGLAQLLNLEIRGRGLFRALFLIPWVIPDVVTALLWKWMYNDEFGVINFVLNRAGLISRPIQWLSNPDTAMLSVILVQIWKVYPLMTIVLLAALQSVPKELYEAAMLDGANTWQRFINVTFPLIRPTSIVITLLLGIWTFQNFDIVFLLTGGGPAGATQILATLVYERAFFALDLGYAAALGVLMLVVLLGMSIVYLSSYQSQQTP